MPQLDGGTLIGEHLATRGIAHLFTLCGGHISPILVGARRHGLRVIDMRDEKSAVFAADAVARMTGRPGVAAVTAGPGVTNTLTAVKNAQMAQSPVLLLGGATATILKGRGSLQDIDQLSLMAPVTKWATTVKTRAALVPTLARALDIAQDGVPGPVFVEVPVDLLYDEAVVRDWYFKESGIQGKRDLASRALGVYLSGHLYRQFHAPHLPLELPSLPRLRRPGRGPLARAAQLLTTAERPVLVVGSQTLAGCRHPARLAGAIEQLGIPTFLGGTARGLLGATSALQLRHHRSRALREADLVIVCGFPFDFRLGYGRAIGKQATLIAVNLHRDELYQNRRPDLAIEMHAGQFLERLAEMRSAPGERWDGWLRTLRQREEERDAEIAGRPAAAGRGIDPVQLLRRLDALMADDAILVVDGGDFVATASYIVRPRQPLSWLDPGVFGTLGVGGGFAVGAAACQPGRQLWLLWGDGSCAYSLAEFDTCVRHRLAPIAIVGNDGAWAQIAREQVEVLGDDIGTVLRQSSYHRAAEGYGAVGLLLDDPARIDEILGQAIEHARTGTPVLVNAHIARSDFRKGSISM
jgi:acetolactate synthase-1/2/3 large subunit